jgi:hypothetical protein
VVLPAMVCDTSLRLGHCCDSRMRAFTRTTVVPKMNTSSECSGWGKIHRRDSGRACDVRATRAVPSHLPVCGWDTGGSCENSRIH